MTHCPLPKDVESPSHGYPPSVSALPGGEGLDKGARILKNRYSPDERPHVLAISLSGLDVTISS